jgi:hypothetical protein
LRTGRFAGRVPTQAVEAGVFGIVAGVCALLVSLRPLNFLSDDSLFYLVIARHIAAGDGSTFNGLFPTNGYHPLWEGVAALLALILPTKSVLLLGGIWVQWLCEVTAVIVLLRSLRQILSAAARAVFVGVMLLLFVAAGNLYWTEAPMTVLFLALVLAIVLQEEPRHFVLLGVWLGLLFLSRLDNVFLVACLVMGLWARRRDWRLAYTCLACGLIAAVYLAGNLYWFGHLMPISGAVKAALYRHQYFSGVLGANGLLSLAGAVALLLLNLASGLRPWRWRSAMIALAAGVVLQAAYIKVLTYGDTWWVWYYVPGYFCVGLFAADLLDRLLSGDRRYLGPVLLAGCVAACVAIGGFKYQWNSSTHDPGGRSGNWREAWIAAVGRAVPDPASVLVIFDQPGLFAYGTSHPVLSLDGLTSNYQVDALLARDGMYAQLARLKDAYLVIPQVAAGAELHAAVTTQTGYQTGQIVHFATPLSGADAGCVSLADSGLVGRIDVPPVLHGGVWGIWHLTPQTLSRVPCPTRAVPERGAGYVTSAASRP